MAFDTRLTFTLGHNEKGNNPKRPDYRGELTMDDGRKYKLSGWIRQNKAKGTEFISGNLQLVESTPPGPAEHAPEPEKQPRTEPQRAFKVQELDEDTPF